MNHTALVALQRQGVALESEPGGRKLGELVHAVLAAIPAHRADLVEEFVEYFGGQRGLGTSIHRRAVELVLSALAPESSPAAPIERSWREVPFATSDQAGITEGAIDVVSEGALYNEVLDFKTDAVATPQMEELKALYSPQITAYLRVVTSVGSKTANGQVVFLRERAKASRAVDDET